MSQFSGVDWCNWWSPLFRV